VVEAFLFEEVAPHPRYPPLSSWASDCVSVYAPTPAASVGSLLGLKPYSAISFLRSSSLFFLAFLFLHKKNPNKNAAAITTIGMMTAMAILAPVFRPPDEFEVVPEVLKAVGVGDEDEVVMAEEVVNVFAVGVV
jgi:hypothetical protein